VFLVRISPKKVEEEITDEPQVVLDVENPKDPQKVQQRFFESGMRADSQETYFQRNQMRRRFRPRLNYANRRNSAYLQQNSAENSEKTPNTRGSIATLDRRPNRPPFHHMGPLPASRRGGPPYVRYQNQRIQQQTNQQIGKRIGVLENMQEMITLAKNEIAVLRNLAKKYYRRW